MNAKIWMAAGLAAALMVSGCRKTADNTSNYKSAIDAYYAVHPSCLWPQPVKFPAQADTSDSSQTTQYDALFDAGLLTRTTGEKKVMIIATRQVTNYDLSDNGRGVWTSDATEPGYGNFCYGHRAVQSIQNAAPNSGQPGAATQVTYTYSFSGAPGWAQAAETQNAFSQVRADLTAQGNATATLVDTANGWQMQPLHKVSNPDSSIVQ